VTGVGGNTTDGETITFYQNGVNIGSSTLTHGATIFTALCLRWGPIRYSELRRRRKLCCQRYISCRQFHGGEGVNHHGDHNQRA